MAGGIIGRDGELASVGVFLDRLPRGLAVLAIEGDPGIGKTTLWRAATEAARRRGYLALASRPVGPEAGHSFAALADLFAPVGRELLDPLPAPQRHALDAALWAEAEEPVLDRRAVPAAVLSVLRELSRLALGRLRRRRREKQLAATALAEALAEFERIGAPLWAAQARAELARARPVHPTAGELTATEHRITDLAAEGLTNREIAARLFISPKTVEANLAKAYRKLGVRSKAELARHMATLAARRA
jgi:DNA-binding CsgD family transcriptional regulator